MVQPKRNITESHARSVATHATGAGRVHDFAAANSSSQKRKRGRPKLDSSEAHSVIVATRFTKAEKIRLEQLAATYGISVSELLRRRALGAKMPHVATDQERIVKATNALLRLGVNLNQLALKANVRDRVSMDELYELIVRINQTMDELDESY